MAPIIREHVCASSDGSDVPEFCQSLNCSHTHRMIVDEAACLNIWLLGGYVFETSIDLELITAS